MKPILGVLRAHPLVFLNLLGTLALHTDIVPALVTVAEHPSVESVLGFVKAHQDVATTLFVQIVGDLKANPELLTAILNAVDPQSAAVPA
jgi:hypothetical protein